MKEQEFYTLRQASVRIGCGITTLRNKVQSGEIEARKTAGKHGRRWEVAAAEVERLRRVYEEFSDTPSVSESSETSGDPDISEAPDPPHSSNSSDRSDYVSTAAHIHALELLHETQEELRLIERQKLALEFQLHQERKLLAENSESIIEREARARQAEEKLKEENEAFQALQAEVQEIREAKLKAEKSTAELNEQLRVARAELVQWEEQRRQSWWKKVFSSG